MSTLFFILFTGLGFFPGPLVFQSLESETEKNEPIFNRVQFIPGSEKDIWLMQQSHEGLNEDYEKWDRLAIVVDKTVIPKIAKFYQFKPGSLEFSKNNEALPYKARCFACHVNGPRAILPNENLELSFKEQIKISLWNLRIKTYGLVESKAGQDSEKPFKSDLKIMNQPLGLKSCTLCHSKDGIRNELKVEHIGTASFMIKNGFMPPFPFKLSKEDKNILLEMMGN